jgi:hypothetical protein
MGVVCGDTPNKNNNNNNNNGLQPALYNGWGMVKPHSQSNEGKSVATAVKGTRILRLARPSLIDRALSQPKLIFKN